MGDDFFSSFSYSFGSYNSSTGFNSIGGSGYAGQNVTFQGTTASGFDGFTSNPFITSSTTTGFTQDQSIVGTANYQIGVDYTNNAVSGFANPNTGGAQSLTLDNTYYTIQAGSDAYLTTQFNTLGSIAEIQTLTATVIANTQGVDDTYPISDTIDNTILTRADDGVSLNVPLSVNQFNVQIKTTESTTVADSTSSGLSTTTQQQTVVTQAADDTITNDEALAFLQQNVDTAIALRESIVYELDGLGRDPESSVITIDGVKGFTLDAAEAAIDGAYAALYAYKDNLPALVIELQDLALQTISEYQAAVDAGATVRLPKDIGPVDSQTTSTTVDTTGSTVASSSILSLAETPTDTTLPTIDEGDTAIQTVEVTANTSVSKAIRDSLGLPNQGPILEKLIDKAITLALNQIPGYPQINSAIGTANKIVKIGDIVTNVDLSPAETALALARLFVPQINLVVQGYNLVTAGGSGGAAEILEPIPVNTTVDVQAGGAGEEEDPPPGSIDFGPAAVTSEQDPQAVPTTTESTTAAFQNANLTAIAPVGNFVVAYNVETGTYDVYNLDTNEIVAGGFTQAQATEYADALNVGDDFEALNVQSRANAEARFNEGPANVTITEDPSLYPNGLPYDDNGNLNPGWSLDENNNPVFVGGDFVEPATQASAAASIADASRVQALKNQANSQASIAAQRKQANEGDWRVKLRLAEGADYLYRDPKINENGILWPLTVTNGVVFPYTPQISTNYAANYNHYDLTHSNYRGYFYQNSYVDEINITATFTAQDTTEANYMLAVIHFFRSVTKMFYGQDANRGQPPPLVFLQGLGEFQFNLHPCLVRSFNYNLPNDVDYIRARSPNIDGTNLLGRRDRSNLPSGPSWLSNLRLGAAGLQPGGVNPPPAPPSLGTTSPTYVPTKLDMTITLLPTQTRSQVSKQFSLKQFANGDLVKGGFW